MTEPFTSYADLAEEGEAYERALMTWFEDHGERSRKPWPQPEIDKKRRRLAWVQKVISLCRRAQERAAQ